MGQNGEKQKHIYLFKFISALLSVWMCPIKSPLKRQCKRYQYLLVRKLKDNPYNAHKQVESRFGCIDILINNAALFDMAPLPEVTRASYDRLFSVNVAGTLFTMQAVAKRMIARGKGGKIINMASEAGRSGQAMVGVS